MGWIKRFGMANPQIYSREYLFEIAVNKVEKWDPIPTSNAFLDSVGFAPWKLLSIAEILENPTRTILMLDVEPIILPENHQDGIVLMNKRSS